MAFTKSFPKEVKGSSYPQWVEVSLTDKEEKEVEDKANRENKELMKRCLLEAKEVALSSGLKDYDSVVTMIAVSLFDKRASHSVYWKENRCREKFESGNKREAGNDEHKMG